jgi:hypothetical protein
MGVQMDATIMPLTISHPTVCFLFGIGADSVVRDVTFNNVNINTVGHPGRRRGTALVRYTSA